MTSGEAERTSSSSSTDCSGASRPSGDRRAQQIEQQIQRRAGARPPSAAAAAARSPAPGSGPAPAAAPSPASCRAAPAPGAAAGADAATIAAAAGHSVAPISRTTSPDIMLCPAGAASRSAAAVAAGRPAVTCSTSAPSWRARSSAGRARPRRAGPGDPRTAGSAPAQRQRPGRPQQRQPVAHGSSSRSTVPRRSSVSIRPTTRSSCSSLACDMSRSSAGQRRARPLMRWPPAAARRGRGSSITLAPVRQSSCSRTRRPRSNRMSWPPRHAAALAVVRVEHRQRRPDLLQHLALHRPLVAGHRFPQAADLAPAVEQPFRPGENAAHPLARPAACQRAQQSHAPLAAGRGPAAAPRSASRRVRSATPSTGAASPALASPRRPTIGRSDSDAASAAGRASPRCATAALDRRPDRRRDVGDLLDLLEQAVDRSAQPGATCARWPLDHRPQLAIVAGEPAPVDALEPGLLAAGG